MVSGAFLLLLIVGDSTCWLMDSQPRVAFVGDMRQRGHVRDLPTMLLYAAANRTQCG
jgi:hypothetical protein